MTTALVILGSLALIGWVSDKAQAPKGWDEFMTRWQQQPPTVVVVAAPRPAPEHKPRIINPLDQTYDGEWTTLSAP